MTKRYAKWYVGTALLAACLGNADPSLAASADASSESGLAGRDAAREVMGQFGTTEGLRQRTAEPLTAGGQLQTLDGETTGSAYLTQPSSSAFMTILAQPGGTGDLATVQIGQDTNFSGTADYGYTLPMRVSGVCANGIISCDAGTWQNCTPYEWRADTTGKVSLQTTVLGNLGGCYCINTSCGSGLAWSNMSLLLKDLGGGAVGAVQAIKTGYVVTQTDIDGPTIAYYGQDTTNPSTGSGSVAQSQYYSSSAAITGDAESMAVAQAGDPDSTYSAMLASFSQRGADYDIRNCSITRLISVDGPECPEGIYNSQLDWCELPTSELDMTLTGNGAASTSMSTGAVFQMWHGLTVTVSGDQVSYEASMTDDDGTHEWSSAVTTLPELPADSYSGALYGVELVGNTVRGYIDNEYTDGIDLSYLCPDGQPPVNDSCYVADPLCPLSESINDNCVSIASDPDCSLRREEVDGVLTFANSSPTGLSPLPSQRTYGVSGCITDLTRNWWGKDLEYFCQTDSTFSFGDAGQRVHTISQSTLDNDPAPVVPYDDKRRDPATGEWLAESGSVNLPDLPTVDECQNVCKTRRPVEDTQVGYDGPTSNLLSDNQGWEFYYRTCIDTTCPLELPGEEILTPCGCINEFAEATTIMMTLDQAAKDLICSSGAKQ